MAENEKSSPSLEVLLVEDNPGDARLIKELLSEVEGRFNLETVGRLSHALDRLNRGNFQLVLLDLSLPDSRGISTFHAMIERFPRIPIIVLSGSADERLAWQTVREGAQDYLVKGHVDDHALIRAIHYAIKRMEAEQALADERNLLRGVIDNLPDSIYVTDLDGRYLLDNLAHCRILGARSPEEVVGKTVFDFFSEAAARVAFDDDQKVIQSGLPVVNREERRTTRSMWNGVRIHWISTTKVPLRDGNGKIIGVIGIERDITARKEAEEQLDRYHAEIRARNQELEDDLHMAREIQQSFLPQQYPTFPRHSTPAESALRFYSRYIPTTSVGGDFFHILPLSDSRAGVFICDVMGHGVRAALVTAIQRALVEEMLPVASDPGLFLGEINRALLSILQRARTPMFASAFYLVVDVARGEMRYANAGHPRPLHVHRDHGTLEFLASEHSGPALGVFADATYPANVCRIQEGDFVVLFTDGLYEVEGEDESLLDPEKLLEIISQHLDESSERLIDNVISEVKEFARDHVFNDDVCLVGVEIERIFSSSLVGARK